MKALINSGITVVGTIFLLMLARSLLLAQMGEATGGKKRKEPEKMEKTDKAPKLEYLREKDMGFYGTIVMRLAEKCGEDENSGNATNILDQKKELCETLKLVKKLNQWHQKHTKQMGTKQAVASIFRSQIHASVLDDLVVLKSQYYLLLYPATAETIQNKVDIIFDDNPNRVYLNAALKETVVQLIMELKKATKYNNIDEHKLVYKFLCICQKIAFVFTKNREEKTEWAYQQFALNWVIHSLLVYHQKSYYNPNSANANANGDELQRMAEIWPIGMAIKEEEEEETAEHTEEFISMTYITSFQAPNLANLTEMSKHFYGTIVVPMMRKCANRDFYLHSFGQKIGLCARVKKVTELFIGLNGGGKQNASQTKGEEEISPIDTDTFTYKIKTIAFHDLVRLQADQNLSNDEKIQIHEVVKIAEPEITVENMETFSFATFYRSIRVNLAKTFGEAFGQIIEYLKSVKNLGEDGTFGSQKVAYKLLCIGDYLHVKYSYGTEALIWAFQQFVANLAIYALRLDQHSQEKIQQIAKSWPLGMFADEAIIEPSQEHNIA